MSSVKAERAKRAFFLSKSFFSFFLSDRFRVSKRFPGNGNDARPLLFLLSVHGPTGTAPIDSCGHSQETNAPNLQNGSLPTQVRAGCAPFQIVSVGLFHGFKCQMG
jgi:hypothetical protein